jgi:hypothetical protein
MSPEGSILNIQKLIAKVFKKQTRSKPMENLQPETEKIPSVPVELP